MHEVSICQSIINILNEQISEDELCYVREVHLKIGLLSCVEPKILEHVYSFMIVDSALQASVLKTELVNIEAQCERCDQIFVVEQYKFICPYCTAPTSKILRGQELQIHKIIAENHLHEEVNQQTDGHFASA